MAIVPNLYSRAGARDGVTKVKIGNHAAGATDQDLEQLTSLFRLLADKTRLNILLLLSDGERNVTSLCGELKLPQPTVSHHLGLLRMNNVISNRRNGKQVFYSLHGKVDTMNGDALHVGLQNFMVQVSARPADTL
jgi:DNA-binding transcriptional ArsR family regulator